MGFVRNSLAAAIAAALSAQAIADTEQNSSTPDAEHQLDMVQVVGQATAGVDDVITLEELEKVQAVDLNDVFALNPEVSAGGAVALGQKIYVRNVGEDMVNITVDGASQSSGVFHHSGRVVIDPDLLKQVEIEAGAGSSTAGIGALGGAVRFVTKDPEDLLRGDENIGATLKSTYFSNGESLKHSATVYGTDDKGMFSGLINLVRADFNNQEDGSGDEIIGSESDNSVGFAKLVTNINDQQKLSLSYESLQQEGDLLYRPEWIPSDSNPMAGTEANRKTIIANYQLNSGDLLNLSVNAYQSSVEQLREDASLLPGDKQDGSVETLGLTIENTSIIGSNKLIYGINYRDDKAQLDTFSDADGDRIYETPDRHKEDSQVKAVYVQDIVSVTDSLTLTAGLRYDDYVLNDVNGEKITDSAVSPNISANYQINQAFAISAGYAEAIRGATVKDSYTVYEGSYTYDKDIEAERAKNIEIGADFKSGPFSAAAGVYKTIIDDAIAKQYGYLWSNELVNTDDIETNGYYLKGGYQQDGINVIASFHSANTEQNDEAVERYIHGSTATSIGDTLVIDANYQFNDAWFVGWTGQHVRDLDEMEYDLTWVNPRSGDALEYQIATEKTGYTTHDLYLRWSPMVDETVVVNLTAKNVLDADYLNHASIADYTDNEGFEAISGQKDAGRDIRLSLALKI